MDVVRQDHPSINVERIPCAGKCGGGAKVFDPPDQQVAGPVLKVHGKEIRTARDATAFVVWHEGSMAALG